MIALLLSLTAPASACGGFFCDTQPVLQAAERVVFGLDPEEGEVEMHVQITYEGSPMDFAWVVPVPANPELFVTSGALFPQLARRTQPTFDLQVRTEGRCKESRSDLTDGATDLIVDSPDAVGSSGDGNYHDVEIVSQQVVGPYDTVVLQAAGVEDLTGWLRDNGYDIPDALEPLLSPYVQEEAHFVALKLQSGNDTGDLAPLALRWQADKASIPVQLTSVAATPDMRMEAYLLADARGVPESYLHVRINEAAIDWWQAGANYDAVITRAADEAGGHAFATDYFGGTEILDDLLIRDRAYDRDRLLDASTAPEWLGAIVGMVQVAPPELLDVVEEHVPLPPGVTAQQVLGCPACFDLSGPFDPVAITDDAEVRAIEPLQAAQALLDRYDYVTRLTSSLDAVEMTVDPVFVLNEAMTSEPVPAAHVAELVYECERSKWRDEVLRRLVLADGRELYLPSEEWLREQGMTEAEFLEEHGDIAAQVIEETGAEGDPAILVDHTNALLEQAEAHNAWVRDLVGCGCSTSDGRGAAGGLLLAMSLLLRQRR